MIRILDKTPKRKKTHIRFEFDHKGKVYQKTLVLKNELYDALSSQELLQRVRGKVLSERKKKERARKTTEEE